MTLIGLSSPRCKAVLAWLLTLSAGALLAPPARAVLPPGVYSGMQRAAPEVLQIEVTAVWQQKQSETRELKIMGVVVEARVLAVKRTATRLKAGARITIHYEDQLPKTPGYINENNLAPLAKGDRCPAYLQQTANQPAAYEPAAGTYTFEKYKE